MKHNGAERDRQKIAFACLPGLESFLPNIISSLQNSGRYDVRPCCSNSMVEIAEAVKWADIVWLEWANELAIAITQSDLLKDKNTVCRLHSYEAFAGYALHIDWAKVNSLIFVAEHIRDFVFKQFAALGRQLPDFATYIVSNGVDLDQFPLQKDKGAGFNLAFLGDINYKKGPMLLLHAFQRLISKDSRYQLYIAGNFQDARYALYFSQMVRDMGLNDNLHMDGRISHGKVPKWLSDKHYILCTSVLESQGMGLMEAMACGLEPIIHNFVGAKSIYPEGYLWNTIDEFKEKILYGAATPKEYRQFVAEKYSLQQQMVNIVEVLDDLPVSPGSIID